MAPPGSLPPPAPSCRADRPGDRHLQLVVPIRRDRPGLDTVAPPLRPGSFVWLRNHPDDLPPFQLIRCHGERCWVRQQSWGRQVHWEVPHRRLRAAS
jgi:hypothetical protein